MQLWLMFCSSKDAGAEPKGRKHRAPDEGTGTSQTNSAKPGSAKGAALTSLTLVTFSGTQGAWALSLTRRKILGNTDTLEMTNFVLVFMKKTNLYCQICLLDFQLKQMLDRYFKS